jgi:hypothetical protein
MNTQDAPYAVIDPNNGHPPSTSKLPHSFYKDLREHQTELHLIFHTQIKQLSKILYTKIFHAPTKLTQ